MGCRSLFDGELSECDRENIHFGEVGLEESQLVTAGYHGWTMVVTGTGTTIDEAQSEAYRRVRRVVIPDLRYRNDIGDKLIANDFATVERLSLLGD